MTGRYAGVNNAKITNRPTCGGDTKQGIVSKATGQSGLTRVQSNSKTNIRTNINYKLSLSRSCNIPGKNNKVVGLTTRIGGITRM
tara:strand:+ start:8365 stop:8619 length:255 start_codon:yes stop_codon:yes gene_type:complete